MTDLEEVPHEETPTPTPQIERVEWAEPEPEEAPLRKVLSRIDDEDVLRKGLSDA